ncbi:flagellar hook assembly protein FlgD [Aliarcobacter vitoriensis]|uniref:Basal-body rod modification protein FlgD n=1 Tax=Aliarcobacter vitoriensis TaxID=2011099 RepID=A0A366MTZ5_9BACT|nr:flagellar hook capping FlgD N-terminal domain-containing protein [Aliarcobacter vitoriensis]RBQ29748.1 flagellar biosynthesis protein FlgD [Aliarcobacter vitoriensis]RBQ31347.1 flagellar biosynthesis protein FlgD [Arcobacter sp. FW59]
MADSLTVSSSTDTYGNQYTQSVSNDQLTTNDFLKLMIEELKLQDPTKPMDSAKMLSTQMQMSTLNANQEMIKALQSIQTAFNQSSLSTATGVIGHKVENGSTYDDGTSKQFAVTSIEMQDGEVIVVGREYKYSIYEIAIKEGEGDDAKYKAVAYDSNGNILDDKGEKTGKTVVLESIGKPKVQDGKMIIKDEDGKEIKDHSYLFTGTTYPQYADEDIKFPFSSITKIA